MFKMMYSKKNDNNAALTGIRAMPLKDSTSDNNNSFSLNRHAFVGATPVTPNTEAHKIEKKWFGNRDASSVTSRRRYNSVGENSLNANGGLMSFTSYKDINDTNNALRRVRAGGATVPPKANAYNKIF
tara:strand:- start:106 stop:489 length:384 start_codon:yes stop_codon:yes gene_type:complete